MAVDMFLKLEGIPGESTDDKHKGEIDLISWSWGASQQGTFGSGGGGGAGKVAISDFNFTKFMDKSSPILFLHCANGKHIPSAVLTLRKAGEQQLEYYKLTMTDVLVSSFQSGGSVGGDDRVQESISLNFSKMVSEYKEQDAKGTLGAAVQAGWDSQKNVKA